jgi:hypothetical protein
MTFSRPPTDMKCPQWKKPMSKVCPTCPWWQQVRGMNPQTGADVDGFDCAMALVPMLIIDNARLQRGTQAATESMRNEIIKRMDGHRPPPPAVDEAIAITERQRHVIEDQRA